MSVINNMACFFCKGELEEGSATHVTDIGERVIIVRAVPCLKCDQCGETSYTGTVFEKLESIINKLRNTSTEVAIVRYSNSAA